MMMSRLAVLTFVAVSFMPHLANSAHSSLITMSKISTQSGGRRIRVDKYAPLQSGKRPVILVLHGAGGTLLDGPEMRRVARQLAEAGNTVYLVHYFNQTGTVVALDAGMQKNFPAWLATVRDCIKFAQQDSTNSSPVGVYGYSLGGFLALAAASDNPAVGAVVEHAGGIWNGQAERIKHMPPVLVVHGEEDGRVPFQKYATPLVAVLRERGATPKMQFFPDEGHVFTAVAMSNVRNAAVEFFHQYLGRK
jgi:dienelactone hydrolase